MRTKTNENGQVEVIFSAEVIGELSEKIFTNSNGTEFKVVPIQFEDKHGKVQKRSAMIYKGSYEKGIEIGKNYLATATKGEGNKAYIRLSHLEYVDNNITADMFDFSTTEVKETTTTKNKVVEEKLN